VRGRHRLGASLGALPLVTPALYSPLTVSFPYPQLAVPTDSLRDQLQATLGAAYALTGELGGGGMSRVFLARDVALERDVVVKVLSPDLAAGVSAERFTREIKLAAGLQQANIVPLHSAGETDGLPYYTMPFVDGLSLRARIERNGALPVGEAISVLRDVTRALAYAHEHGVVHRDIKPENILLSGDAAVVTDFGIAKALAASKTEAPGGTLTQVGTSIGTPAYMAPEQAAGDPATDHRADLYALGCVAYELLAGAAPFAGRPTHQLFAAHLTETPAPLESWRADVPPALAQLVARCLEKDPSARPQSAREVLTALDGSGFAPTAGRGAAASAGSGRRSAVMIASVSTMLLLAAALAGLAGPWSSRAVTSPTVRPAPRSNALGDRIPTRYQADTALFARYLRANALVERNELRAARDSFQAIVDAAPLYAPAWGGLSTALSQLGLDDIPPLDALPRSAAAANRALALDSTLVHAQSTLIAYDLFGAWDLAAAKRRLDASLVMYPDEPRLNELLASWHRSRGELSELVALRRHILKMDPLNGAYAQSLGMNLYFAHRCAEAVETLQRVVEGYRETPYARYNLYRALRCLGQMDEAAAALRASLLASGDTMLARELDPPMPPARRDSALRRVTRAQLGRFMERRARGWATARVAATSYADLGDRDSTLMWLDSMWVERSMTLSTVPFDPTFDLLHGDARFEAFVRRLPWRNRRTEPPTAPNGAAVAR
jgi:tetratricopeptide (TPR) repeat protein